MFVVSSGIVVSYSADRFSALASSVPVMLPVVVSLLFSKGVFPEAMGSFGIVYFVYLYSNLKTDETKITINGRYLPNSFIGRHAQNVWSDV